MKHKVLILFVILFSFLGYLEWGTHQKTFLFEAEYLIMTKLFTDFKAVIHLFTIIPLFGQFLLLFTLFQKKPNTILIYSGIASLSLLFLFLFLIGLLSLKIKILLSSLPFLILASYTIVYTKKLKKIHS